MALSKVPLKLGTRRRLVLPLLLATTLALVAVTVLLHFNSAPSSTSSTDLGSTAAYIAGLVRIGASHPDNDGDGDSEWERGIGPADSWPNWQRGTDGDRVQLENGTTVTYRNPFGGTFDADPFSYEARAQRFTKPLSEQWDWETDRIRGVNLGGWLSLEPFISPSLFERYLDHELEPARDEWTLSQLVRADKRLGPVAVGAADEASLGTERLDRFLRGEHYDQFILGGIEDHLMKPCLKWAADFNRTFSSFGIPVSGEFSLAINDCGRFLNNVGEGNRLEGTFPNKLHPQFPPNAPVGTCEFWERYDMWDEAMKSSLQDFARAQMNAFQNWFYWTWKTTSSSRHFPHLEANPLWSYSLGVREGWILRDPRDAEGFCFSHPRGGDDVAEPRRYPRRPTDPWKVGKAGSEVPGPIPPEVRERDHAIWPPLELNPPNGGVDGTGEGPGTANLPVYERGRENASPLRGPIGSRKVHGRLDWVQPIEGCDYPDAWGGGQDYQGASSCTAAERGVA